MSVTISVILPAYNEEQNIIKAVQKSIVTLSRLASDFEIIVVDDGSRDKTKEAVQRLVKAHHPYIRLLSHQENRGYGTALRTGFRHARHCLIFFTDSDNQFDVAELEYLLPFVDHYDAVVGFRVYRYDPVIRCILSWFYNRLVGLLFRLNLRDVDCAFKLFRREALDRITLECDDFFVSTELMAKARRWNFRIIERGVRHYPREAGETTVRPSDVPRTLKTLARMWFRINFPQWTSWLSKDKHQYHGTGVAEYIP